MEQDRRRRELQQAMRLGIGCMRLSTDRDRDDDRALAVIAAALRAGVTWLDTADAYALDERDVGHNERLIARALAAWGGDRARVVVATKGGLVRPEGRWVADGRAKHLRAACEASAQRLGRPLDLYQLHAPDPATPFATSVRALAALLRDGTTRAIGLCNVTVGQVEQALGIAPIAAIQVSLDLLDEDTFRTHVAAMSIARDIALLAHTPFGGARRRARVAQHPTLISVAARHAVSPFAIVLAYMRDLHPRILPLPGPTRLETVVDCAASGTVVLSDADRALLDASFPLAANLRKPAPAPPEEASRPAELRQPPPANGDIVLVMGYPGAGKSTLVAPFVARDYERLNRDERGGTLAGIATLLDRGLTEGKRRFVLDNTYPSRRLRAPVLEIAAKHGVPVRCVWLTTSLEEAQVNACQRMIERYGRLLMPEDIARMSRKDPNAFGPMALFRFRRELEPPDRSEGFVSVEERGFVRRRDPSQTERAVIIDLDGIVIESARGLRSPTSAEDVTLVPGWRDALRRLADDRWLIFGTTWQPEVATRQKDASAVAGLLERTRELVGIDMRFGVCPHAAGPPTCWCRKPLPGLGVAFIHERHLDPARSVHVGRGAADRGFAERLGFHYVEGDDFFARVGMARL